MSVATLPRMQRTKRKVGRKWMVLAGVTVALAGVLYIAFGSHPTTAPTATVSQVFEVVPMDLEIKVNKDGEIYAVDNTDINCQVEGGSTITWIVAEGTSVKKGETILTLDSTAIRQKIEDTTLDLKKAEADLSSSRETLEIQKSQNDTNLESAEVALDLARLDLKQYDEGTYPQQFADATTQVEMTKITLKNREEDLDQTRKLYTRSFVTAADVKKAELDVTTAQNDYEKAKTALRVLTDYSHAMDQTARKNTLVQAEQKVLRTKRENTANLSMRQVDLNAKEQALLLLQRRMARLKEQNANCTVTAPADGMVIYGTSTDRNAQNPIQEGAQVRERQLLVRLPDTTSMKAVVRIHEALVPKLKVGQKANVKIVGFPGDNSAALSKISVLVDNSNRWWNPDLREYPVDLTLDHAPKGLKPGVGASVEILIDRIPNALVVPLDAVYSTGSDRYVFVRSSERIVPVKVTVGANSDTHVQVLDGIKAGQQVLRLQAGQGRDLLEKAGIQADSTTGPGKRERGKDTGRS